MADGEHYTTLEASNILRHSYAAAAPGESGCSPRPAAEPRRSPTTPFRPTSGPILIASGRQADLPATPIRPPIRSSAGNSRDGPYSARPKPRATPPSRPTARQIAYSDRNDLYVYDTAAPVTRAASPTTEPGTRSSTARPTGSTRRSSASRRPMPSRPTAAASPTCASTRAQVPLMEMMRFDGKLYNHAYSFKYPKAGERNSDGPTLGLPTSRPAPKSASTRVRETDQYIPRIGWTPDGRLVLLPPQPPPEHLRGDSLRA